MTIDDMVTDVQHARAIVNTVGQRYQMSVIDKLRSVSCNYVTHESERMAEKIIGHMEHEYALNVANVLWKDRFDEIPQWLKDYSN